jgi:hypothetical protein
VQAMGAAMRGEYDSLERFGIALTADAVAQEMARLASEGLTFASEAQAKAVATLSLIQQQATAILGEGEEQTVTMTSAMGHLRASVQNLAAEIGGPLMAVLGPLIETFADVIDKLIVAIEESELLQAVFDLLAGAAEAVKEVLDALAPIIQTVSDVLHDLWAIIDGPVLAVLEALGTALDVIADALSTVIGWVEGAIDAFQRFIDIVHEAVDALTFWNDTYQASAPVPAVAGHGMIPHTRATEPAGRGTVNITVQMGVGDPHAVAREIRKILSRDAARLGRPRIVTAA